MFDGSVWSDESGVAVWEEQTTVDTTLEDLLTGRRLTSASRSKALGMSVKWVGVPEGLEGTFGAQHAGMRHETSTMAEGLRVDAGYSSPLFVTELTSMTTSLTDAYVFVQHGRFTSPESLLPLLGKVAGTGRPLLVIADVEGEAMSMLLVNKLRHMIELCVVKPPGFGEERAGLLEDIAIAVGAHTLSPTIGRSVGSLSLEELGRAEHIIVGSKCTRLFGGKGSKRDIRARMSELQEQLVLGASSRPAMALRARLHGLGASVGGWDVAQRVGVPVSS